MADVVLQTITELWRPVHGRLVKGIELVTDEFALLSRLMDYTPLSPRQMKHPVDLEYGGGLAYTVDGGTVAHAVNNAPVEATLTYAWLTKRFDVTVGQMDAKTNAKFREARITEQLAYQGKMAVRTFHRGLSVGFYSGLNNVFAKVNDVVSAPTYGLKDHFGLAGVVPPVAYFVKNKDTVTFIDPGTGLPRANRAKVTATDPGASPPTFTLAASITAGAINDLVVLANQGDNTGTDYNLGFEGMLDHLAATTLFGISSTVQPAWKPAVYNTNLGAALSGTELYKAFALAEQLSGYTPNFAFTTIGVVAAAGGAQLDQRRYGSDEDTMRIGFKNITTMGVTPKTSPWIPAKTFIADSTKSLMKLAPDSDIKSVEEAGSPWRAYDSRLGFFTDDWFRLGLPRKSRASLIGYLNVTEA